ncbi:protein transport protein S31 [Nowakowskiella sp. JEL0407]|nr:protein transport protein S31 [Nowakowskiella sp. JEL0407]
MVWFNPDSEPAVPFNLYKGQSSSNEADINALITRTVILSDFDVAVEVCLKTDRFAGALVLAIQGGPELTQKTQLEYFEKKKEKSYLRVLNSFVKGNFFDIVENAELKGCWRDIFALVCTHAKPEDIGTLLTHLGRQLESYAKKNISNDERFGAVLCYLKAGDVAGVVNLWVPLLDSNSKQPTSGHQRRQSIKLEKILVVTLQSMIEKITIFRHAVGFVDHELDFNEDDHPLTFPLNKLCRTYAEYAFAAVELGEMDVAWKILELIPKQYKWSPIASLKAKSELVSPSMVAEPKNVIGELKDRLYRSGSLRVSSAVDPGFPFELVDVAGPVAPAVPAKTNKPAMYFSDPTSSYTNTAGYGNTTLNNYGYQQASQPTLIIRTINRQ